MTPPPNAHADQRERSVAAEKFGAASVPGAEVLGERVFAEQVQAGCVIIAFTLSF